MDDSAFAEIVRSTKKVVLAAVRRNLYERFQESIDDVVQETYYRAYRSLSRGAFQNRSKMSTWLYAIARNESLRMNAKMSREESGERRISPAGDSRSEETENYQTEKESLLQMINELPKIYGEVLQMYFDGKTEKEIGSLLSISQGTVKSRAFRGKKLLRAMREGANHEALRI